MGTPMKTSEEPFVPFIYRKLRQPLSCSTISQTSTSAPSRSHAPTPRTNSTRRRRPRLPAPLLGQVLDAVAGHILADTVHRMVHALEQRGGPGWHTPWTRAVLPLALTCRRLRHALNAHIRVLFGVSVRAPSAPPALALRAVRGLADDAEAREARFAAWARAPDAREVVPLLRRGGPLERLYRASVYAPWLLYVSTRQLAGVDGVADVHMQVCEEVEAARIECGVISAGLFRRLDRMYAQLADGARVMQCAKAADEVRGRMEEPTRKTFEQAKNDTVSIATKLSRCARRTRSTEPASVAMVSYGLVCLVKLLVCMNDPEVDMLVGSVVEESQHPEVLELWLYYVGKHTTHMQRRRLLGDRET